MAAWKRLFHRTARGSRALGLGVTLALTGVALVAPGGCALDRQGLSTGGSASTSSTTTGATTSSASSTTSTGSCTTGPGCTPCVTATDCAPPTFDGCTASICVDSVCAPKDTTGMAAATQTANDCHKNVCGADGKPAPEDDPLDLPADDGNACTDQTCVQGVPTFPPVAMGTVCANGTCDDKGNCFNCTKNSDCTTGLTPTCDKALNTCVTCDDTVKNGTETAADCGGNCKTCKGDSCNNDGECITGQCADSLCCDSDCMGPCQACNLPGLGGKCSNVPAGQPSPSCNGATQACNGAGMCKAAAGVACMTNTDCGSGSCFAQQCRIETGGVCMTDLACASGLCAGGVCINCLVNTDCASMKCNVGTGVCQVPGGAECDQDTDCAIGKCMPFRLCQVLDSGACAKAADCRSGVCKGALCVPCSATNTCSGNATCGSAPFGPNTCNLPKGAYCFNSGQCVAGDMCTGYPATCQ